MTSRRGAAAAPAPGALHAWPKVSAPTARAPARWRRSTAGVDGRSGVAPVAFRRKSRSEKWRRRQRDANAFSGIRAHRGEFILSEMIKVCNRTSVENFGRIAAARAGAKYRGPYKPATSKLRVECVPSAATGPSKLLPSNKPSEVRAQRTKPHPW